MRTLVAFFALITVLPEVAAIPDIEANYAYLTGLGSRSDGTVAERLALDHIAKTLDDLNITHSRKPLDSGERGHSFSENIIAQIPGSRDGLYVLATPIDGGAFSMALLLEMAKELTINRPKNTVAFLFLGAEKGDTHFHPYGSRLALRELTQREDIFALYLDSDENPRTWNMEIGSNKTLNPSWFVEGLIDALSSESIPFSLRLTDILVARLGLKNNTSLPETWLDVGIPTISLAGSEFAEIDENDAHTRRLLNALLSLDYIFEEIPSGWESTYLVISSMSRMYSRIVREGTYVTVFLAISAAFVVVILIWIRNIKLNMKRFARYSWTLPLLLAIVFLFLFLSTLFVEMALLLSEFPRLWENSPGTFVFFKLTVATTLSLMYILVTNGLPLIRNPHFYSYAAIGAASLTFLIFIALDITVAAYSLWTIVSLLLLISTRNMKLKIIFLILSVIPHIVGLVLLEPYSNIIESLLLSRISGNLVISLLLFPIVLAITSLNYWNLHYFRKRTNMLIPAATFTLCLTAIITLIWIIRLSPYDGDNLQPVSLIDDIDLSNGERHIQVSSPGPIGLANILVNEKTYRLAGSQRTEKIQIPLDELPLDVITSTQTFLGRRTIRVTIKGEKNPKKIVATLQSNSPFTLHSANFPFEMKPSGILASIFIGNYPPFPITLQFTVNNDARLRLIINGFWINPEDPQLINRPDLDIALTKKVYQETEL